LLCRTLPYTDRSGRTADLYNHFVCANIVT
jgi:hypothetical protein